MILSGGFHRQMSLAGYSPWGGKESDMTEDYNNQTHRYYKNSTWLHICKHRANWGAEWSPHESPQIIVKCRPHSRCYYSRWKGTKVEAMMVTITFSGTMYLIFLNPENPAWWVLFLSTLCRSWTMAQSTEDQAGSEQVAEGGPSI